MKLALGAIRVYLKQTISHKIQDKAAERERESERTIAKLCTYVSICAQAKQRRSCRHESVAVFSPHAMRLSPIFIFYFSIIEAFFTLYSFALFCSRLFMDLHQTKSMLLGIVCDVYVWMVCVQLGRRCVLVCSIFCVCVLISSEFIFNYG